MRSPDAQRYARLEALHDAVSELDPQARQRWLAEHCGDDATLRADVLAMFTDTEPGHRFREIAAQVGQSLQGLGEVTTAGPYRLLHALGSGGMGTVYAAERADGVFQRRVAIKLLRGLPSTEALARLRRERQILARLEHPNIARLIDGGETTRGRPYLVLELVEGAAIDRHADARRLTLPQRVELFLPVCEAIAAAHRQLVVHCDIKPANVMVDGEGRVRVLDFGVANLMDGAQGRKPGSEVRLMTRDYASPEQLRNEGVGTASDIYSLGLLLGELLAGAAPVNERRALPMSAWSSLERASAARVTTATALRRALRGDLDAIVQRATASQVANRYADVQGLIDDLRRWLRGHGVHARNGGALYRAGKFLLRQRWRLAAALLVGTSLAALAAQYLVERRITAMQAQVVRGVAATMRDVFVSGAMAAHGDRPARELVLYNAERLRRVAHIEPLVKARLYYLFGLAMANVGDSRAADGMIMEAVRMRAAVVGGLDTEAARVQAAAVQLALDGSDAARASARLAPLLELPVAVYPMDGEDALERVSLRGQLAVLQGEREAGMAQLRHAYQEALRLYGAGHVRVASHADRYARVLNASGQHEQARAVAAVAWRLYERTFGPDADQLAVFRQLHLAPP